MAGGNVWDSLADLLKIMKLRGVGADDVKEVREIVQHLFTNIVKPREDQRYRLKRRRDTRYVGYNHSNSDALTGDECLPQAHCFNSRIQLRK